jgi:hypothetical protein
MTKRLNQDAIRPLDYGFSADVSLFSFAEKAEINGLEAAASDWPPRLPAHVLQFVSVFGRLKILEMCVDKNDHNVMRLTMSSVTKYDNNGPLGDRIVAIKRCRFYDDVLTRDRANDRHLQRWADGNTFYDIEELFCFPSWLKKTFGLRNDPGRFVCSSEIEDELNRDGYTFTAFPLMKIDGSPRTMPELISPFDIVQSLYVHNRNGNKFGLDDVENFYC